MDENESYIFGLLITDGNLSLNTRNRGKVTLEINKRDEDIIEKLFNLIPNSKIHERVRNTNFKNNYESKIFSNFQKNFRDKLIEEGFPTKDKTNQAAPPNKLYEKYSFWRGVIDGDGSLGLTKENKPFVSLVTKSEKLKDAYVNFLKDELNVIRNPNRNKRDNVYNITIFGDKAIELSEKLYLLNPNEIHISRKFNKALEIQKYKKQQ